MTKPPRPPIVCSPWPIWPGPELEPEIERLRQQQEAGKQDAIAAAQKDLADQRKQADKSLNAQRQAAESEDLDTRQRAAQDKQDVLGKKADDKAASDSNYRQSIAESRESYKAVQNKLAAAEEKKAEKIEASQVAKATAQDWIAQEQKEFFAKFNPMTYVNGAIQSFNDFKDRLALVRQNAADAGYEEFEILEQQVAIAFYDATGATNFFRAFTGEDPVTLKKYTGWAAIEELGTGVLKLASTIAGGIRALQMLKGPCGGYIFRRCFIAGTQIVVGENPAFGTTEVWADQNSSTTENGLTKIGCFILFIGVAGAAVLKYNEKKKKQPKGLIRDRRTRG